MLDPQGYPIQQYTNLEGDIVLEVMSDGTIVLITGVTLSSGSGSPESVITAPVGSWYVDKDGVDPDIWFQKQTGSGNTGWVAIGSGGGGGTPGGNSTNVQFNNAGAFDGSANFTYAEGIGVGLIQVSTAIQGSTDLADTGDLEAFTAIFSASLNNTALATANVVRPLLLEASAGALNNTLQLLQLDGMSIALACGSAITLDQLNGISFDTAAIDPGATINDAYGIHIGDWTAIPASGISRAIKVDGGTVQFSDITISPTVIQTDPSTDPINIIADGAQISLASSGTSMGDPTGNAVQTVAATGTVRLFDNNGDALELANGACFVSVPLAAASLKLSDVAPTTGAGEIGFGNVTDTTVGAAGGASALPATPTGYIVVSIGGTDFKIPFYAAA